MYRAEINLTQSTEYTLASIRRMLGRMLVVPVGYSSALGTGRARGGGGCVGKPLPVGRLSGLPRG